MLPFIGETYQHAQRLTLSVVDTFIEDLKSSVREAKESPSGTGTMVAIYGTFYRAMSPLSIIRRPSILLPFLLLLFVFISCTQ